MAKIYKLKDLNRASMQVLLFFVLQVLCFGLKAQVNLAPLATASAAPACNLNPTCNTLNDNILGTCGTQQMWISSAASNPGSAVNVTFTWPSIQVVNKMTIHVGESGTRFLTGGTIQIFNGTTWVTHATFTQATGVCNYDINFNSVACSALRIIDMTVGGSQSSNVNFREIQIWQGSLSGNDVGISSIDSVGTVCSTTPVPVYATIKNYGTNQVTSANIYWSANGALQGVIPFTGTLDTIGGTGSHSATILLGNLGFSTSGTLVKAWTGQPNSTADTIRVNDTSSIARTVALTAGNYTIGGAGANYATFAAAINALYTRGICGPVTFTVANGTYTEQIKFDGVIPGISANNTVTFMGSSKVNTILNFAATVSTDRHTVLFTGGARFITFRDMTIRGNGNNTSDYAYPVIINGGARSIRIANCNITIVGANSLSGTTFYIPVLLGGTSTSYSSGSRVDSVEIDTCFISRGYFGVVNYGVSGNLGLNNKFRGNTFSESYFYGYYGIQNGNLTLENNIFNLQTATTGITPIYVSTATAPAGFRHVITNNLMNTIGTYGIFLSNVTNQLGNKGIIANNVVGGNQVNPTGFGIYLSSINQFMIVHNSVSLTSSASTAATQAGIYLLSGTGNSIINNNLARTAPSIGMALYVTNITSVDTCNYNNYFKQDTIAGLIYFGTTLFPANFRGASTQNVNSMNVHPSYIGTSNLNIINPCSKGMPYPSVPNDYMGSLRSLTAPNVGAYELASVGDNLGIERVLTPSPSSFVMGTNDVWALVRNYGTNSVASYTVGYTNNNGTPVTQVVTTAIGSCDTASVFFIGSNQVTLTSSNLLKVFTSSPNSSIDSFPTNDTLQVNLFAPLSGNYTIGGASANFATFGAAVDALKASGVAGHVNFTVNPGTYLERIVLNGVIQGLHDTARVTFRGVNKSTVIIEANAGSAPAVGVFLNRYITFRDMTIRNLAAAGAGVSFVGNTTSNAATGCGVINCIIDLPNASTATSYGVLVTGTATGYGIAAMRADSITIDSNLITRSYYGITCYGASNALYNRFIKIRRNTVAYAYYMGGYIAYNYNAIEFNGNSFTMEPTYGYYGLYYYYNQNSSTTASHIFANNKVTGFGAYGVYMVYPGSASVATAPTYVYNNMIVSGNSYNTMINGLYLQDNSTARTWVINNTIVNRYGVSSTNYGPFYSTGSVNLVVKNNVFANHAGTGTPAYLVTNPAAGNVNHNDYWNTSGTSLIYRNGTFYNATNYRTATNGGDSSYNSNPDFVGAIDLHTKNACMPRGVDYTSLFTTDIDENTRSIPFMLGADEIVGVNNDIELSTLLTPAVPVALGAQDVKVVIKNRGTNTVSSFNVSYRLNNGTPVTIAYSGSGLGTCQFDTLTFTGTNQVTIGLGLNSLKVYTSAPNAVADGDPSNDTVSVGLAAPLAGDYIIGAAPADFPDLASAITAAQSRGVAARTVFKIKTGIYNGTYSISNIPGLSATSTLNITSLASHRDSVRLEFANTTNDLQVINMGTSFVNLNKITVRQTNGVLTTTNSVIRYNGNVQNDTINDCVIWGPMYGVDGTSTSNYGLYVNGNNTNNLVYTNNYFKGSFFGNYFFGNSSTYSVKNTLFQNNLFDSIAYGSFYYLYYTAGTKFIGNTFLNRVVNPSYTAGYQYWYYNDSGYTFTNNLVRNFIGKGIYWYNQYSRNAAGNPGMIYNNEVNASSGFMYWALFGSVTNNTNFYHNTVHAGSNYTYINASGNTNVKMINNVFAGSNTYSIYWSAAPPVIGQIESDNNLYFSTVSTTPIWATVARSLTTYKGAYPTQDRNSVSFRPPFGNASSLIPNATDTNVWLLNGRARHNTIAPADRNNVNRPTAPSNGVPDIGAYEVTPAPGVLAPLATVTPITPTAGGTQHFLLGEDSVAKVTYDITSSLPSSVALRYYTGEPINAQGANGKSVRAGYQLTMTGSGLLYDMALHYKDPLRNNITNHADLRGTNNNVGIWNLFTTSVVDSTRRLVSAPMVTDTSAFWTLTDANDPLVTFLTITSQPQNVTKCVGDSATFTVAATGTAISYQWQLNTGSGFNNITGATGTSYTTGVLTAAFNNYKYRCILTNSLGSAQTNEATLTMGGNTTITTQPMSGSGCQGDNVSFVMGATGTNLSYQWEENMGAGFNAISGAVSSTFIKTNIQASQNGYTYRAIVTGTCGVRTSDTVSLAVSGPINITGQPTPITVSTCAGSTVNISLTATGATTYQWQIDNGSGYVAIPGGTSANLSITNIPASYNGGTLRCVLTNTCNVSFSTSVPVLVQTPGLWSGITSTAWATANNWGCSAVPTSNTDVLIPASAVNMPAASAAVNMRNLTIENGAVVTLTGAAAMNIYGNLNNLGTISGANAWLNFMGTTAQTMNGGTYNKVNVNNSNGLSLTAPLTINDTLAFANGKLTLGANNLTLGNNARITGASTNNYVVTNGAGALVINNIGAGGRTGAVAFHVGTATNYSPATLTNAGTADNYSARVIEGSFDAYTGNTPSGAPLTANTVAANWIIDEQTAGGSNLTVMLQWNASQELAGFTRASSYIARYLANGWNNYAAGAAAGTGPYTRTASGISTLAPMGVGSNGTLPVSWLNFTAKANGMDAVLNWATASENNNKGFVVERSINGSDFEALGFVEGNRNSSAVNTYSFTDYRALEVNRGADIHYRLKQVDFDGNYDYSKVVTLGTEEGSDVSVYPNPFATNAGVFVTAVEDGNIAVEVKDLMGRTVISTSYPVLKGVQYITIENLINLSSGIYMIQVEMNGEVKSFKVQKSN